MSRPLKIEYVDKRCSKCKELTLFVTKNFYTKSLFAYMPEFIAYNLGLLGLYFIYKRFH